jgi:hypothetical protein
VIIKDERGLVMAAKSKTILAIFEPATGEALAALHTAEFCQDLGFYEIMLEGGSLSVVKATGETKQNWLHYGQIVEDGSKISSTMEDMPCQVRSKWSSSWIGEEGV